MARPARHALPGNILSSARTFFATTTRMVFSPGFSKLVISHSNGAFHTAPAAFPLTNTCAASRTGLSSHARMPDGARRALPVPTPRPPPPPRPPHPPPHPRGPPPLRRRVHHRALAEVQEHSPARAQHRLRSRHRALVGGRARVELAALVVRPRPQRRHLYGVGRIGEPHRPVGADIYRRDRRTARGGDCRRGLFGEHQHARSTPRNLRTRAPYARLEPVGRF